MTPDPMPDKQPRPDRAQDDLSRFTPDPPNADKLTDTKTIHSLSFTERTALLDFADGKKPDRTHLDALERRGLVSFVPSLTVRGCEIAEEGGWVWTD